MGTAFDRIIGLDLGKFNSVACVHDVAGGTQSFASVQTTPQALHDFLVAHHLGSTRLVVETCDVAGWVHDLARSLGIDVVVVSPSGEAWNWVKVKRKTDRDDAQKLVRLTLMNELTPVHVPSPEQRQRRRLVLLRRSLVDRRTLCRNTIRSIHSQQGLQLPKGNKCWTQAGLEQLQNDARPLVDCSMEELWRGRLQVELDLHAALCEQIATVEKKLDELGQADGRVKLLRTVPGVGPRLAEAVVVQLDDPHRFKSAREVAAYAGLVPRQFESGTMKRSGRITRRGPRLLRSLLVEVAWMMTLRNAWAKSVVERVSGGAASRRKIAIVALARKLITVLWSMLKHNRPWRDPLTVNMEHEDSLRETVEELPSGRHLAHPAVSVG